MKKPRLRYQIEVSPAEGKTLRGEHCFKSWLRDCSQSAVCRIGAAGRDTSSCSLLLLATHQAVLCSGAGGAHRAEVPEVPLGSRPAALPPFTAVAPGPIPAELHPGSSFWSPQASHCLGLVSEQSLANFPLLQRWRVEREGMEASFPCRPAARPAA